MVKHPSVPTYLSNSVITEPSTPVSHGILLLDDADHISDPQAQVELTRTNNIKHSLRQANNVNKMINDERNLLISRHDSVKVFAGPVGGT